MAISLLNLPTAVSKAVTALSIIIFALIMGLLIKKVIKKILHELEIDKILKEEGIKLPVEEFVAAMAKYLIYFIGVIWALTEIGLATTVLHILLIVILVIVTIFIILAVKDFVPNITAGIFIHQRGIVKKGDYIKVKSVEGTVMEIDLVEIKIKTNEGDVMLIPNSVLTKNEVLKKKSSEAQ
ncbi:mechanosensitive ion channel [Candidatus Woesearchaeota archaeon]|nr:mechanosensitive ion channel [Candidatus Woesearchaeota archaeon]